MRDARCKQYSNNRLNLDVLRPTSAYSVFLPFSIRLDQMFDVQTHSFHIPFHFQTRDRNVSFIKRRGPLSRVTNVLVSLSDQRTKNQKKEKEKTRQEQKGRRRKKDKEETRERAFRNARLRLREGGRIGRSANVPGRREQERKRKKQERRANEQEQNTQGLTEEKEEQKSKDKRGQRQRQG